MSAGSPFGGAFPHQHGDPLSLRERIDAQLRARIEAAVEMAGLEVMVEVRKRAGRRLPEDDNPRDRDELVALAGSFLDHLHEALGPALPDAEHAGFERITAEPGDPGSRRLAGQVFLAKRLPDYWQRFETLRGDFSRARLGVASEGAGWLRRLFGS